MISTYPPPPLLVQSPPLPHASQFQTMRNTPPQVRSGTLAIGTRVKIGDYKVTIERFLSEGGFAHVYLVRSSQPIHSPVSSEQYLHVLKRLAVPTKQELQFVRKEVDIMKAVRGHPHIINFIEASASELPNKGGYEVFILMEYAPGGGIIDMMNTRLGADNRLTEAEILKIFGDTVQAVAYMHHQSPPLMHRDLKVENILLASPTCFKLCDFGSATNPLAMPPQSVPEIQALEADLNRTTTLQYRAPEMCDVWSRKPVGLPADIWALGVFLYKLCYYTTPFEAHGVLAIQNVQYSFPSFPVYSSRLQTLIMTMLVEDQRQRPSIDRIHDEVCRFRGIDRQPLMSPLTNTIPAAPTTTQNVVPPPAAKPKSQPLRKPTLPPRPPAGSMEEDTRAVAESPTGESVFVARHASPPQNHASVFGETIKPMRRGRPISTAHKAATDPSNADAGFDDSFSPKDSDHAKSLPESDYAAFEKSYPSLDSLDTSHSAPSVKVHESKHSPPPLSPKPKRESHPVSDLPKTASDSSLAPHAQVVRHASGFKNLLSPSPSLDNKQTDQTAPSETTTTDVSDLKPSPKSTWTAKTYGQKSVLDRYRPELINRASQTSPELLDRALDRRKAKQEEAASSQSRHSSKPAQKTSEPTQTTSAIVIPDLMDEPDVYEDKIDLIDNDKDAKQGEGLLHRRSTTDIAESVLPVLRSPEPVNNGDDSDSSDEAEPEDLDAQNRYAKADRQQTPSSTAASLQRNAISPHSAIPQAKPSPLPKPGSLASLVQQSGGDAQSPKISLPLHAPVAQSTKPKKAISSLVSRYETVSPEPIRVRAPSAATNKPRPQSMVVNNGVPFQLVGLKTADDGSVARKISQPTSPEPVTEEESFQGVASMRARWQNMSQGNANAQR